MGVYYRAGIALGYYVEKENIFRAARVLNVDDYNVGDEIEELTGCELICLDYYSNDPEYILGIFMESVNAGSCDYIGIEDLAVDDDELLKVKEVYEKYFKLPDDEEDEPQYLYFCQVL